MWMYTNMCTYRCTPLYVHVQYRIVHYTVVYTIYSTIHWCTLHMRTLHAHTPIWYILTSPHIGASSWYVHIRYSTCTILPVYTVYTVLTPTWCNCLLTLPGREWKWAPGRVSVCIWYSVLYSTVYTVYCTSAYTVCAHSVLYIWVYTTICTCTLSGVYCTYTTCAYTT